MKKRKFYIVLIVVLLNVVFYGCEKENNSIELGTVSGENTDWSQENSACIYVHISGAVKNPGVYSVAEGTRLYQVIGMAGGLTKKAKQDLLNLAETVIDGQKIHVMSKKEYKRQNSVDDEDTKDGSSNDESDDLVNINTASESQLTKLPGIGPSKATAIVAYREENGMFSSVENIKNVSGIGDATFSNIESMITVN